MQLHKLISMQKKQWDFLRSVFYSVDIIFSHLLIILHYQTGKHPGSFPLHGRLSVLLYHYWSCHRFLGLPEYGLLFLLLKWSLLCYVCTFIEGREKKNLKFRKGCFHEFLSRIVWSNDILYCLNYPEINDPENVSKNKIVYVTVNSSKKCLFCIENG